HLAESTHRIPYTWDFGFMLARPEAWRNAFAMRLPGLRSNVGPYDPDPSNPSSVRTVIYALRFGKHLDNGKYDRDNRRFEKDGLYGIPGHEKTIEMLNDLPDSKPDMLGWRVFLEACCVVADNCRELRVRPFDIDLTAHEALTATVLEMWFSELRF